MELLSALPGRVAGIPRCPHWPSYSLWPTKVGCYPTILTVSPASFHWFGDGGANNGSSRRCNGVSLGLHSYIRTGARAGLDVKMELQGIILRAVISSPLWHSLSYIVPYVFCFLPPKLSEARALSDQFQQNIGVEVCHIFYKTETCMSTFACSFLRVHNLTFYQGTWAL